MSSSTLSFPYPPAKFGDFNAVCARAALVVCPLLENPQGIEPICYARNVQLGSQLIFQPATCFVHIVALIMTAIMVYHVRLKYTAVGRKEILTFFYIYFLTELLGVFLDSAIIPTAHVVYPWFTAVYAGFIGALYWSLVVNGFVGFQLYEDGTPTSLWSLRISTIVVGGISFFVAIATFKNIGSLKYTNPIGLYVTYLIFPGVCAIVYTVSQLVLVVRTLDDMWSVGHILAGFLFFVCGIVLLLAFSATICNRVSHYVDGTFFSAICLLLAVMMVYKYWDSITKEDLEFSVGSKTNMWDVKDPLLPPTADYMDEDTVSNFRGAGGSLVGGKTGNNYYGSPSTYGNYMPAPRSYAPSSVSGHGGRYAAQAGYSGPS